MRYRRTIVFAILASCIALNCAYAKNIKVQSSPKEASQYELYRIEFNLPYFAENPNDVNKVDVEAVFTLPSGSEVNMPAFCKKNKTRDIASVTLV